MKRASIWAVLGGVGAALIVPVACETGGVVGGECADGLTLCDGKCVDLRDDEQNCGKCDEVCPTGVQCIAGICGGDGSVPADASDAPADGPDFDVSVDRDVPDAGDGGADTGDAPFIDGGDAAPDGPPTDGPQTDGPLTDGPLVDNCVPPFDTPLACGDCFTQCTGATPICSPVDGSFQCVPLCTPPLENCGGQCVDTNSDPEHCGMCFKTCPTGLCQGGMCVGATVGHEVLFCMNYDRPVVSSPQTTLLGNAIFLPFVDPVRILAYDEFTKNSNRVKVEQAIDMAATAKGRSFNLTNVSQSASVPTMLSVLDFEVFLVMDQSEATSGTLGAIGNGWMATLDSFARAGGSVVVLSSTNGVAEMGNLMTNAGLLNVNGQTDNTFSVLHNRSPADAVGLNVPSPFLALQDTCFFDTSDTPAADTVFVVTDAPPGSDAGLGNPVVVHRTKLP